MDYKSTKELLDNLGQSQLLEYYDELTEEQQRILLDEIEKIDFSVVKYIFNSVKKKKTGKLSPIPSKSLEDIKANSDKYEKAGLKLLKKNKVAAVLLAGGQGTRLGYDKPKGMFNIGETRNLSIFEQQMNNIKDVVSKSGKYFHLFVMTSEVTHDETVAFFKENDNFGYPEDKIHFFEQDTEPSCDSNGKVLLAEKYKVAKSPNGNGGWFSSLMNSGFNKIIADEGIEWLNVYGVDNVLQRICDPVFIGATSLSGCNCSAKVVKKVQADEKVGVLCVEDGKPCVIEYYELPPEQASMCDSDGQLTLRYGVILNYLFNVKGLYKIFKKKLPRHVAKKAVPHYENGVLVKPDKPNGYKFETLVVDMVKLLGSCLAFEVEREKEFAPVKNKTGVDSVETARELLKANGVEL